MTDQLTEAECFGCSPEMVEAMQAAYKLGYARGREDAAKVCEKMEFIVRTRDHERACLACAAAIRAKG